MGIKVSNYGELLAALQTLTPEQLAQPVRQLQTEEQFKIVNELCTMGVDVYSDGDEDGGTIEELKSIHGDEYDESKYKLCISKDTLFLWCD